MRRDPQPIELLIKKKKKKKKLFSITILQVFVFELFINKKTKMQTNKTSLRW
jgi:hypothetical protein